MRIGLIHLSSRYDTWAKYILWCMRRYFPQHEMIECGEALDVDEYRWRPADCDVYVRVEDSGAYHTPEGYRPLIYWCGDTHIRDGVPRKQIARDADYTFVAQKNAVGVIGDEWARHCAWYVWEPSRYPRWTVSSAVTLAAENPIFAARTKIAQTIKSTFGGTQICGGIYFKQMADLYANSAIVWNHPVNNDLGMRIMEGFACGTCVVTGRIQDNGLEDVFGDIPIQYDTEEECIDLLSKHLAKPEDLRERGRAGREIVMKGELYRHRLERLVGRCEVMGQKT